MTFTIFDYLIFYGLFAAGQLLHLFWIKTPELKKLNKAGNKTFYFKEWWACDSSSIVGMAIFGVIAIAVLPNILGISPGIWKYLRIVFFFMGFMGSSVIMSKLSQFKDQALKLVDIKSNISDTLTGKTTTSVKETIAKGEEVTGQDVTKPPVQ